MKRCFIALDIPEETRDEIENIQSELPTDLFLGKLTEKDNIHLTLKFLGEIDDTTLRSVLERLDTIDRSSFDLIISDAGVFSRNCPRIIWLSAESLSLRELQKDVDKSISDIFPMERRFMGHMTIARIKECNDRETLLTKIKGIRPRILSRITSFSLVSSRLTKLGPIYETIERFSLH